MRPLLAAFRRLTFQHVGWLVFKVIMGIGWPIALITLTPISLLGSLGWVIYFMAITTLVGGVVSSLGLIATAQTGRLAVLGLSIELSGLSLFIVGPLTYAFTYTALSIYGFGHISNITFIPITIFAYGMVAAIFNRILIVAPQRSLEAHGIPKKK